jgi:uncharacterized protein YjgD (DUF1641 family)
MKTKEKQTQIQVYVDKSVRNDLNCLCESNEIFVDSLLKQFIKEVLDNGTSAIDILSRVAKKQTVKIDGVYKYRFLVERDKQNG